MIIIIIKTDICYYGLIPPNKPQSPSAPTMAEAIAIETWEEFEKNVLHYTGGRLVVVDYVSISCGDCIALTPFFVQQVRKFPNVLFYEVDIDDCPEIKNWEKVKKLPLIKFYRYGKCLETITEGNTSKITAALNKHSQ